MSKRIYLWGMPGSGKSTLGKPLAQAFNLPFVDLDEIIEQKEGRSIPKIFSEKGEDYFRELEKNCLSELIDSSENFVLSTGGGTPCFFDNAERMAQDGLTVLLGVSAEELTRRLCDGGLAHRPIFSQTEQEEVLVEIQEKLAHRKEFYDRAALRIYNDNIGSDELIQKIREEKRLV